MQLPQQQIVEQLVRPEHGPTELILEVPNPLIPGPDGGVRVPKLVLDPAVAPEIDFNNLTPNDLEALAEQPAGAVQAHVGLDGFSLSIDTGHGWLDIAGLLGVIVAVGFVRYRWPGAFSFRSKTKEPENT